MIDSLLLTRFAYLIAFAILMWVWSGLMAAYGAIAYLQGKMPRFEAYNKNKQTLAGAMNKCLMLQVFIGGLLWTLCLAILWGRFS